MQCTSPVVMPLYGIERPCRKCLACRLAKAREWQIRVAHENMYHDRACFVTLTYSDEKLPAGSSLRKEDFQGFLKRLRFDLGERKLRYFACGEYGERTSRPHYHAILFGVGMDEHKMHPTLKNYALSGLVVDAWQQGMVYIGNVQAASVRYVCDYIFKSYDGKKAEEVFGKRLPPFKLHSKGLGKDWVKDNQQYLEDNLVIKKGGDAICLPRYYLDKMQGDKQATSIVRAVLHERAEAKKLKKLREQNIDTPEKLKEYLASSRFQRNIELAAKKQRMREKRARQV